MHFVAGGGFRANWSATAKRPRRDYSESWLEHKVRDAHQSVIEEPVPQDLLDIVARLPELGSKRQPGAG